MKGRLLTLIMSLPLLLYAQQSPVVGGGDATGGGGTVSFSIGQIDYTAKGAGPTASEGVQQAFEVTNLPVELLYFEAKAVDNSEVELTWETATELNNDYFTVERSVSGTDWEYVGKVNGAGTSTDRRSYKLLDDEPYFGTSYYRLKQTDYDGTYAYSETRSVYLKNSISLSIHPNPTKGTLTIQVEMEDGNDISMTYEIIGVKGQILMEGTLTSPTNLMDLSSLSGGVYYLRVRAENADTISKRIIKIK